MAAAGASTDSAALHRVKRPFLSPLNQRRWQNFKANRRGYWSVWIFLVLFVLSLGAEFIANDKPLIAFYKGEILLPVLIDYPEEKFGGFYAIADYRDPVIEDEIRANGWLLWPPIRYSYSSVNNNIPEAAPAKPSWMYDRQTRCQRYPLGVDDPNCTIGNWNWLGTDDQARDVLARVIYGFRISVLFGLVLTLASTVIGVAAGAVQGYFGGWTDLLFQRFIEIWSAIPVLYLILIISAVLPPGFFILLGILLVFSWVALVPVVRAEFLRARNFEYVNAARALGVSNLTIMRRHLSAQRDGRDADLPALHPQRVDHHADLARLPRLRPAAGLGLARRVAAARPAQPQRAVARHDGFLHAFRHAFAPDFHRRSDPRRLRSEEDVQVSVPLLSVRDLSVAFLQGGKAVTAVDHISFDIAKGETVALVGESGSGKSVSALSVLKLLSYPPASHPSGKILFQGNDLLAEGEKELRRVRGNKITMIFQEPMTSLNPLHTIEQQIVEVLSLHQGMGDKQARARTLALFKEVGIREPEKRLGAYPHQLSGGQRQRVMIAMALANEPELLIADEPTTALDVTVQAQILELLASLKARKGMSMLFITHDLGIVRKIADRVCVMTKGKIVETGPDGRDLRQSAACLYAPSARRRAEGQATGRRRLGKNGNVRFRHKGLVPDQAGFLPHDGRSCEGGRRHRRHGARGPDARRGRRVRIGQDHARPGARPDDLVRRAHSFRRA